MIFGTQHKIDSIGDINIMHGTHRLEKVNKYKYLGLVLDPKLTFHEHVAYIKSKTYAKIKLLGRLQNIIVHDTALTIYKTLILPNFDYCDYLMVNISKQDAESLQKLQNCAFRSILHVNCLISTAWTHTTLCMDTLHESDFLAHPSGNKSYLKQELPLTFLNLKI